MNWSLILQVVGTTLGLLYLYLEYKANIWLWLIGLIMPLVHGMLYFSKGLYADAMMNVYYVLAGLYGWIVWKNKKPAGKPLPISQTPASVWAKLAAVYAVLHAALFCFLHFCTDSQVPFLDSFTTALSVVAMWMLSRKYIEQWLVWLVVDMVTVGLYLYKGIPITAGLYTIYCAMAVAGYFRWKRQLLIPAKE